MCAGAALLARVGRIVYGARNAGAGADGSWVSLLPREETGEGGEGEGDGAGDDGGGDAFSYPSLSPLPPLPSRPHPSHPALEVTRGVLAHECGGLLKDFFRRRRAEGTRGAGSGGEKV
jgi:tRNA(adenine34) deaminase